MFGRSLTMGTSAWNKTFTTAAIVAAVDLRAGVPLDDRGLVAASRERCALSAHSARLPCPAPVSGPKGAFRWAPGSPSAPARRDRGARRGPAGTRRSPAKPVSLGAGRDDELNRRCGDLKAARPDGPRRGRQRRSGDGGLGPQLTRGCTPPKGARYPTCGPRRVVARDEVYLIFLISPRPSKAGLFLGRTSSE